MLDFMRGGGDLIQTLMTETGGMLMVGYFVANEMTVTDDLRLDSM